MKFSLTIFAFLVTVGSTSASFGKSTTLHSGSAAGKNLLRNARRLQNNNYNGNYGQQQYYGGQGQQQGGGDANEAWYLTDYSLKMLSCAAGERTVNYENGEVQSSTVIFRLCPRDLCNADNSTSRGCEEGYGDFAVGINTFTQAYVESLKDYYNNGMQIYSYSYGEFNVEEYVRECRLFEEGEQQENDQNNQYNNYGTYAYIGAACTEDGTDIRLASFSDPYCSQESDVSFSETHNGFELPYSSGGLIPSDCISCVQQNDNYEYEVAEMCKQTYEDAIYKCEENMESYNSYYGQNNGGCDYVASFVPQNTVSSSWFSGSSKSSSSKSSSSKSEETDVSKSSGNLFTNQPENVKLAEEYIALLVISALVGAAFVIFFVKKTVDKKAAEKGDGFVDVEESTSFMEKAKSAATLVKLKALELAAKAKPTTTSNDPPEGDEDNEGNYVAPSTEIPKIETVYSC